MLQRLEAENIRAYLQNENTITILPNAHGGINLMVHEGQVGRALELLNKFEEDYQHSHQCPVCGSFNVLFVPQRNNRDNLLAIITSWLTGRYAVSIKHVYHCYHCGHEFE